MSRTRCTGGLGLNAQPWIVERGHNESVERSGIKEGDLAEIDLERLLPEADQPGLQFRRVRRVAFTAHRWSALDQNELSDLTSRHIRLADLSDELSSSIATQRRTQTPDRIVYVVTGHDD